MVFEENMVTVFEGLNELFRRLNNLKRWSSLVTESGRNELAKQAMNVTFCYLLACEYEIAKGKPINWTAFPKIAIHRAFQKAYVNFDIVEDTLHEIEGSDESQKFFNKVTKKVIRREMGDDFCKWVETGCGTIEERIYKAATKIATIVELLEIKQKVNGNFEEPYKELLKSSAKYHDIPCFLEFLEEPDPENPEDKKPIKALKDISRLRNKDRWSIYSHTVKCSVLGHLFDTAVIAYVISLEKGWSEEDATKNFFLGAFHDLAEVYTGDIPSPIKDSIKGFRNKSEDYEIKQISQKFVPYFSTNLQKSIINVMFEGFGNESRKDIIKLSDYMSAVDELDRQAIKGSRDKEMYKALVAHEAKLYRYGAGESEILLFKKVEKYCRKTMLVDEAEYTMTWIEIIYERLDGSRTAKRRKKLYKKLLTLGEQLKKCGADSYDIQKYEKIKEYCNELLHH